MYCLHIKMHDLSANTVCLIVVFFSLGLMDFEGFIVKTNTHKIVNIKKETWEIRKFPCTQLISF